MSTLKLGSRIGRYPYRIEKALGQRSGNAMADVYLARDTSLSQDDRVALVVIKVSRVQSKDRDFMEDAIYNEAERLRQFWERGRQRGIVRILPIRTDNEMRTQPYVARATEMDGEPWFLVLEYLNGNSLADLLEQYKRLDIALALEIMRSLAETLDFIHRNDQVHLDIKPENILFRTPIQHDVRIDPVLIDFGIARHTGQARLEAGTLLYAPPERLDRDGPPEVIPRPAPSMDIYSLGVVFYQMVTGRRPFEGRNTRSITSAILAGNPTEPSKHSKVIPSDLDKLLLEMLDRNPIKRPTAGELVDRLQRMKAQPTYALPTTESGTARVIGIKQRRMGRWLKVPIAAIFLLGIGIASIESEIFWRTGQLWEPSQSEVQSWQTSSSQYGEKIVDWWQTLRSAFIPSSNPTATPTAAAVAALPPTATETASATAPPTATATVAATATHAATATPVRPTATSQTSEDRAAATATRKATSTPVPVYTKTATPKPTSTATRTPVPSPTPIAAVATAKPTATTTQNKPNKPTATQSPGEARTAILTQPADGFSAEGKTNFSWSPSFILAENQAFEVNFWKPGQDPTKDGRGWGGTTRSTSQEIDIGGNAEVTPGSYQWGVFLVATNPYRKIQLLSNIRRIEVRK